MYHRFFHIRRSSLIVNWELAPSFLVLTASLVANHFRSSFPAAPKMSLNLLREFKQYTYIKVYKKNSYLLYLLEYVPHGSGYNN